MAGVHSFVPLLFIFNGRSPIIPAASSAKQLQKNQINPHYPNMVYPITGYTILPMERPIVLDKYKLFRELLVQTRENHSITQVQLASKLGKPQSYISKYERGERRLDVIEFIDIMLALDIDPEEFIKELRQKYDG